MNSNRCPECGGTANHLVTDVSGKNYYRCMTGLTTFEKDGGEVRRVSFIIPCDTVIDHQGKVFSGSIAYASSNRLNALLVINGKERR